MKRANEIIGATLLLDVSEVNEYRYQSTRTSAPVYAMSHGYYCCPTVGKKPPTGWRWRKAKDQFFAQRDGRVLYVADTEE